MAGRLRRTLAGPGGAPIWGAGLEGGAPVQDAIPLGNAPILDNHANAPAAKLCALG